MKKFFYLFALIASLMITSCTSVGKLEMAVAAASAECPMELDEVTNVVDIKTEDNNVVYECVVDEDKTGFDVSLFDDVEAKKLLKKEQKSFLQHNLETIEFVKLVKEANYNLIYRYTGSNTGYKFDITIYSYEL